MTLAAFKRPSQPPKREPSPRIPLAVSFWVPGVPLPWKRVVPKSGHPYNPPELKAWEYKITLYAQKAMAALKQKRTSAPVRMHCLFVFPIAKSWLKNDGSFSAEGLRHCWNGILYHTKDPDASNLLKAVEDGCVDVCYDDDNQLFFSGSTKSFGRDPGVHVKIVTP